MQHPSKPLVGNAFVTRRIFQQIQQLVKALIHLRMYVEAAIDFPEEEIDFLADGKIANQLANILEDLNKVQSSAQARHFIT